MDDRITCMVVDDDEVDIALTMAFLEDYPFLKVTGRFDSPTDALAAAQQAPPDVLFLDIDMAELTGFQLRERLAEIPACIFITSFPDYALESYEMNALDFLVKPFSTVRFAKTMQRLENFMTIRKKADLLNHTLGADTIFIKDGTTQVKLQLHEIIYFEALNNYTSIVTTNRKYAVLSTLGGLLKESAFNNFIRIHRSYAVQKHYIKKISSGEVLAGNIALPIGRKYKEVLNSFKIS